MKTFIDFIKRHIDIDGLDINFLQRTLSVKKVKKGELILKEGDVSNEFYFNQSGFVRLFYNNDGEQNTAFFYTENQFISAYESFIRKIPARQNFEALEETSLVVISSKVVEEILKFNPKFEILARIAMEEELIVCQSIIESLLSKSPEERYYSLLKTNPEYFKRIPQHYIASFIGVKPESLSRIKKRYFNSSKS